MGESDMRGDRPEKLAFDFKETLSKASDMHLCLNIRLEFMVII